jgi:transcriptional regulator with XRE-family HTH domain
MNVLKLLRVKAGLSQDALAKLSGVSQSTINLAELGRRNVRALTIVRLADALNVEYEVLAHLEFQLEGAVAA